MKLPCLLLLLLTTLLFADRNRIETYQVDELKIELPDENIVLEVALERFDDKAIQKKKVGDDYQAWLGSRQLPSEVLWRSPTLIKSFKLSIDGKSIPVPKRFWDDLVGFSLDDGKVTAATPSDNDHFLLEARLSSPMRRPQLSRSAHGGTVLITWARPEE